jgi:hypothetical protein
MERPHLRPIRNRLLAVEVAGMALFSPSAWAGGAVGLGKSLLHKDLNDDHNRIRHSESTLGNVLISS